jgi:hypothetical protein
LTNSILPLLNQAAIDVIKDQVDPVEAAEPLRKA